MTRRERIGLAAVLFGCFVVGWMALPSDGVFCVGETAVNGQRRLEGCAEYRIQYGSDCDIRWPGCAWKRLSKP